MSEMSRDIYDKEVNMKTNISLIARILPLLLVCAPQVSARNYPSYLLHNVFSKAGYVKASGKFFFIPSAVGEKSVAFGFVSKIKPTQEEIVREKARIKRIIDGMIKDEFGSWENYDKEMKKEAGEASQVYGRKAPFWAKILMPPVFVMEVVPLILKGALLYAEVHPEAQKFPIGNLGKTGVLLLNGDKKVVQILLGINQPVESLSFSPDGKYLAVLSDMSFEDKDGKLHIIGKISIIDTAMEKVIKEWIFKNAADEISFSPDGRYLTFLARKQKDWKKVQIVFIDTKEWKLMPKMLCFSSIYISGNISGKNYSVPNYLFSPNGKNIAILLNDKSIGIYDTNSLKPVFTIKGGGGAYAFAHRKPYLFDDNGRLWNYKTREMIFKVNEKQRIREVRFSPYDKFAYYVNNFGKLKKIDTSSGKVIASSDFWARAGIFLLSEDGRYIATFKNDINNNKLSLKILDANNLLLLQRINNVYPSVLDAAFGKNGTLFISSCEKIWVYNK